AAPDRVGRQAAEPLAFEAHLACVGAQLAGQHVEERGLARAVRADEGADLALRHREVHADDRAYPAERLREPARLEHRAGGGGRGGAHGPRPSSTPAMPRGKASTSTMRIAPSTICQ